MTIDRLKIGNRRRRPKRLRADKGYDGLKFRQALRQRHIKPAVDARDYPNRKQPSRLWDDRSDIRYAPCRWKMGQRFACLDQNRRLNFLYETTREAYEGFLTLAMIRCYLKVLSRCKRRLFRCPHINLMTQEQQSQLGKFKDKFTRWMYGDSELSLYLAQAQFLVALGLT